MHVQTITEQELAEILDDAIDLSYGPGGIIRGQGADVCRFTVVQGMMSDEIVLVSEFPVRVMPPDPTEEELEEFRRNVMATTAKFAGRLDG